MVKYNLPFINKGNPFSMPNWTTKKHEAALTEMLEETEQFKKYKGDKVINQDEVDKIQNDYFKYYVILQSLREIDDSVSIDDLIPLHPDTLVQLFNAVYSAGRIDIIYRKEKDFQKTPISKKK